VARKAKKAAKPRARKTRKSAAKRITTHVMATAPVTDAEGDSWTVFMAEADAVVAKSPFEGTVALVQGAGLCQCPPGQHPVLEPEQQPDGSIRFRCVCVNN
jgi:hypothetical protein